MAQGPRKRSKEKGALALPGVAARPEDELRASIQRFVRSFGLLTADQTPCGVPLSPSHAHALMLLLERERSAKSSAQQDLVKLLGIDKSNVARLCAKMTERGHVRQEESPTDGRVWTLALTPPGRRLAERVENASRSRFERMLGALPSDATRTSVIRSLDLLNDAIAVTRRMEEPQ